MKNIVLIISLSIGLFGFSQSKEKFVFGIVTDGISPLKNVNVQILDTSNGTLTDENGEYRIKTTPSDILVYSHIGMYDEEVVVEDVTNRLNIEMRMKTEELDEVVITKKINRRNQDYLRLQYGINKDIVNTSFGFIDKDRSGYSLRVIDGKDLSSGAIDILSALQGRLAGLHIRTVGNLGERALFMRGGGSISNPKPAIFDVDGMLMTQAPLYLSVENIDRVAVMPGLAGVVRYGLLAAGGVVIINTKGSVVVKEPGTNRLYDRAKLRGNIYRNDAIDQEAVINNSTNYIKELYESKNLIEAKKKYGNYAISLKTNPYFFIDSYLFFVAKGDKTYATKILQNNIKLFENAVQTKALAYALDVTDQTNMANQFYQEIFSLRPNYAQSYRDLANSYRENLKYKKAVNLFVRYQHLVKEGFFANDSSGIQTIIEGELENLLILNGNDISNNTDLVISDSIESKLEGTRLFFEWNDSEAEFDLQFVNPENHYFIWEHSNESNFDRIRDEKIRGYSCEEFFIDESLPGKWQVNIKYKGNKNLSSTYLKITTTMDYNKPSQKSISKLYRLQLKNVNQKLITINNVVSY